MVHFTCYTFVFCREKWGFCHFVKYIISGSDILNITTKQNLATSAPKQYHSYRNTKGLVLKQYLKDILCQRAYPVAPLALYVRATEYCSCTLWEKPASYSSLIPSFLTAFSAPKATMTETPRV